MKAKAHTLISQFDGMATLIGIYATQEQAEAKLISMVRYEVKKHPEIAMHLEWCKKQDGSIDCVYADGLRCRGIIIDLTIDETSFDVEI